MMRRLNSPNDRRLRALIAAMVCALLALRGGAEALALQAAASGQAVLCLGAQLAWIDGDGEVQVSPDPCPAIGLASAVGPSALTSMTPPVSSRPGSPAPRGARAALRATHGYWGRAPPA